MKQIKSRIYLLAVCLALIGLGVACSDDGPDGPNKNNETIEDVSIIFDETFELGSSGFLLSKTEIYVCNLYLQSGFRNIAGAFIFLGKTKSISSVTNIPTDGWVDNEDERLPFNNGKEIEPGDTFILRMPVKDGNVIEYNYAKFRVTGYIYGSGYETSDNITGVKAELVYPFVLPIKLKQNKIELPGEPSEKTIDFEYPTNAKIVSKPDWADVSFGPSSVTITCKANAWDDSREGEIKIGNDRNTVSIKVVQTIPDETVFGGGTGTKEDPFLISTARHLDNIRLMTKAYYYLQTEDIDLADFIKKNGGSWTPIENFTGEYDGGFKEIANLKIYSNGRDGRTQYSALFGSAHNATFRNMIFRNVHIGTNFFAAVICAKASASTVSRCKTYGDGVIYTSDAYSTPLIAGIILGTDETYVYVSECETGIPLSTEGGIAFGITNATLENCNVLAEITGRPNDFGVDIYGLGNLATNSYIAAGYTGTYDRLYGHEELVTIEFGKLFGNKASTGCHSLITNTEAELKQKSTYVGWDFDNIWTIDEGVSYPRLRCFENK